MSARTRSFSVAGLAVIVLSAVPFWFGHQFAAPPAKEPEPVPQALLETDHLAPPEWAITRTKADWDVVSPPAAPMLAFQISPTAPKIKKPRSTKTVEPQYQPAKSERLQLSELDPGTLTQLSWKSGETLHGAKVSTPILVAKGEQPGSTLCVTAAVHGDELNGIESVRRLMYSINVERLSGTLVGVPIVNLQGFHRQSRYLADRRDLNRFFPGNPRGSVAARIAYAFFNDVVRHCDGLVDLHTGSFHRTNLPQLRADLHNESVLELTKGFGATTILHSVGGEGTLRRSAVQAGIPAVTLEAGEPLRLQEDAVAHTVKAIFTLLDTLEMYDKRSLWGNPEPSYYQSAWVRADQGGMLFSKIKLGRRVKQGDVLGHVTDPITNEQAEVTAPFAGRVIGMAVNQFVMPGYATYHLAAETDLTDPPEADPLHGEEVDLAIIDGTISEDSE